MHLRIVVILVILVMFVSCATRSSFTWGQFPKGLPESSLKLVEDKREMKGGITQVVYRVEARGFAKGTTLELWTKDGVEQKRTGTTFIDDQNKLRWKRTEKGGDFSVAGLIAKAVISATDRLSGKEVRLGHGEYYLAQAREWALYDPTNGQIAFTKVIPFPVEAQGPTGCRLSLELLSPDGMIFNITADGFQAGEELNVASKSEGELVQQKDRFPQSGPLTILILPGVIGKTSGDASYTVEGASCTVTIEYKWGESARILQ